MSNNYETLFSMRTEPEERQDALETIRRIARRHRLTPAQTQAILWVTWHRVTRSNFPGYVSLLKIF